MGDFSSTCPQDQWDALGCAHEQLDDGMMDFLKSRGAKWDVGYDFQKAGQ